MRWQAAFRDEFVPEFRNLPEVQDEVCAVDRLLERFEPKMGRLQVDALNGSRHANMKDMRFCAAGREWRSAFALDPTREAVLPAAGDKGRRLCSALIRKADERIDRHLARPADEGGML